MSSFFDSSLKTLSPKPYTLNPKPSSSPGALNDHQIITEIEDRFDQLEVRSCMEERLRASGSLLLCCMLGPILDVMVRSLLVLAQNGR